MTARWKRITARTVQTSAHRQAAKRGNSARANAALSGQALPAFPGIPVSRSCGIDDVAPVIAELVMRCLKGGGA